jgi:hypothetical protein
VTNSEAGSFNAPGTRSANGKVYTLHYIQNWREEDDRSIAPPPRSGAFQFPLPVGLEGEWRMDLILRDFSGKIFSVDSGTFLVSQAPSLMLRRNRSIVNSTHTVKIECLVSAGAALAPLKLFAFLQTPSAEESSLPSFIQTLEPVSSGTFSNQTVVLLNRTFEEFGEGKYVVSVRLFNGTNDSLLATAQTSFEVCDAISTAQGVLYSSSRNPLNGDTALYAVVAALMWTKEFQLKR